LRVIEPISFHFPRIADTGLVEVQARQHDVAHVARREATASIWRSAASFLRKWMLSTAGQARPQSAPRVPHVLQAITDGATGDPVAIDVDMQVGAGLGGLP
jgi:hypothetical protein